MAHAARLNLRMQKEVKLLLSDPPLGASFPFLSDGSDDLSSLQVQIEGPEGSVYAKGVFELKIQIPERYPFHPPIVNFATPIYHPNIDTGGRICLDILNLPPKGAWQPSLNISTVITSIGLLLSEPNPDDGLMCDASRECKYNRQAFDQKAKAMTEKYAKPVANGQNTSSHSMPSTEAGGSNTGQKKDVLDFVVAPAKPHGISKKLSLESSCLTSKMEKNREEGENLLLRSENLMAAEASRKESNCIVNDGHRWKNQYGTGRKLSLGSSAHIHKKHDHEMGNIESKSSESLCNAQATFAANCWGLSPEQLDDHQADFDQHVCETASWIETICPENPGQLRERTPLESPDKCETGTYEKAAITIGDLSTSESSKNVATRAQPDRLTLINGELQSPKNSVVGAGTDDAPDSMVNKMNVSRKKLSLGLKGTMQRPENCDKENSVPVSVFSTAKKVGTGRKVSRVPLASLLGSNDNNSQHLPADAPKKHRLDHHHTAKAARVDEQGRGEPAVAESELAIVLDSEDSEEEDGRSARSTALLLRKRAAKRKGQSVQTL